MERAKLYNIRFNLCVDLKDFSFMKDIDMVTILGHSIDNTAWVKYPALGTRYQRFQVFRLGLVPGYFIPILSVPGFPRNSFDRFHNADDMIFPKDQHDQEFLLHVHCVDTLLG